MMFQMVVGKEANLGPSVNLALGSQDVDTVPHDALAIPFQDLPYLTFCSLQDAKCPRTSQHLSPFPNS